MIGNRHPGAVSGHAEEVLAMLDTAHNVITEVDAAELRPRMVARQRA